MTAYSEWMYTDTHLHIPLENTPMGDELKWLLKVGGGQIFKSCDISLENTPTSHTVSPICVHIW